MMMTTPPEPLAAKTGTKASALGRFRNPGSRIALGMALGLGLLVACAAWLWAREPAPADTQLEGMAAAQGEVEVAQGKAAILNAPPAADSRSEPTAEAERPDDQASAPTSEGSALDPEGTKEVRRFPDGRVMTIRNDGVVIVKNHPMRIEHQDGRVELRRVTIRAKPKVMTVGSAEQRAAEAAALRRLPDPSVPGRTAAPGRR